MFFILVILSGALFFSEPYGLHNGLFPTQGCGLHHLHVRCRYFGSPVGPVMGAYGKLTVGRQWLIWSFGLAIGFVLQRTMIRSLVVYYAPDVVAYFRNHPQARLNTSALLMILIPYWVVVMVLTMKIARSKQRIQKQAESFTVIPEENTSQKAPSVRKPENVPIDGLKLADRNGKENIALSDITHIRVKDHYSCINNNTGNDLENKMIRLPLKEILPNSRENISFRSIAPTWSMWDISRALQKPGVTIRW
jgi:hypothetical protein